MSTSSIIRAEMTRRGLRQVDVAAQLGMSQAQLSARLTDVVDWRLSELRSLADLLDIRLDVLVGAAA